jgi:hypothetical protein
VKFNLRRKNVGERVGKTSTITSAIAKIRSHPYKTERVSVTDFLVAGHGRALVNIDNKEIKLRFYEKIIGSESLGA